MPVLSSTACYKVGALTDTPAVPEYPRPTQKKGATQHGTLSSSPTWEKLEDTKIWLQRAYANPESQFSRFDNNGDGFLNAADGDEYDSTVIYDANTNSLGLRTADFDEVWFHNVRQLAVSDFIT